MVSKEILDRFKCNGCGECCRWGGSVLLLDEDVRKISDFLGLAEGVFIDKHTRLAPNRKQLALLDQADGSCEFLEGDSCRIYEARPTQCRSFPHGWSVPEGCPVLDELLAQEGD
jgi:Fe-S-cluster containining protein